MTENLKKITAEKQNKNFDQKLRFTCPETFIKDVQVTEEAFSSQNRTSSTSNMKFLNFFLLLWVIFALLDPDPDPQHCEKNTDIFVLMIKL
jgi:hypothetical protein